MNMKKNNVVYADSYITLPLFPNGGIKDGSLNSDMIFIRFDTSDFTKSFRKDFNKTLKKNIKNIMEAGHEAHIQKLLDSGENTPNIIPDDNISFIKNGFIIKTRYMEVIEKFIASASKICCKFNQTLKISFFGKSMEVTIPHTEN